MMMRAVLGVILAGLMLSMALLQPVSLLRVETGDGELVICARVDAHTPVTLTFTHSMFGGFVRETYAVENERLVRQRIVTENAAAAEYYATDGEIASAPDGYEVLAGPFATDELVVRVDEIGNHRLTAGETDWQMFEIFREPAQVRISGDSTPRIRVPDACLSRGANPATKGLIV